jgi:RND family efflux transporter MFP subunit
MERPTDIDLTGLRIDRNRKESGGGRSKRLLWAGILLVSAAVIAGLFLATSLFVGAAVPVRTATASMTSPSAGSALLTASGYVVAQRQAAVSSKATGRLVFLGVEEGDRVKKGDLIGRVESEDVEAALAQARANLEVARGAKATAEARLKEARLTFERTKGLLERKLASQAEYDNAEAAWGVAEANAESAEAAINAARAGERATEVAVENTRIRAPFDGTVLTKTADVGEMVAPFASSQSSRGAVVTMADMSSLEAEADVSESNIQRIRVGAPAEIVLDAYPDYRYTGRVKKIVPTADRAKATVLTKVEFTNIDVRVLPEMSAKVNFLDADAAAETGQPELTVPRAAVVTAENESYVYKVSDGKATKTTVQLGVERGGLQVITSGLAKGDVVVVNPPDELEDGSEVKAE